MGKNGSKTKEGFGIASVFTTALHGIRTDVPELEALLLSKVLGAEAVPSSGWNEENKT